MSQNPADAANRRARKRRVNAGEDEDTLVFEGETLSHSPRLGRRFASWVSQRFD